MSSETDLVTQLAVILIAAGIFTIISKALKQPAILGYIIAGFLVGPKLGIFPQFNATAVNEWSELGIIFLLFGLGLEFSFKKLLKIGSSAFITAFVVFICMFLVGSIVGKAMGWESMESIFLGGMLGMSSTTVIVKAYTDMGLKKKAYANLIFGALVFEDLIAVLLMVLLSTLAVTGQFAGKEMLGGLIKLVFFLTLWFLVGIFLIPLLLKKAKNYLSDEIMLLVGIGLCFLMVVLATLAGFSSALGAFVMGSILAETVEGERIARLTAQVKDLFGAIFFVSVGMLIDPMVIAQYWLPILIITIVVLVGILTFSTCGALLAGQNLDTAVHTGFSMAQLGEFSFIIAGLGCSLGVLRDFIYPVIVTVSVITTFTTPYMIRLGDPISKWLHKALPEQVLSKINNKENVGARSKAEKSDWKQLLTKYVIRIVVYSVILTALLVACPMLLDKMEYMLPRHLSPSAIDWIKTGLIFIVAAPFAYSLSLRGKQVKLLSSKLVRKNHDNVYPLLALVLLRAVIATLFTIKIFGIYNELNWWQWTILFIVFIILFFINSIHSETTMKFEGTFISNLNEKEEVERRRAPVAAKVRDVMGNYDVHILHVSISSDFEYIGKSLREMPFRHTSGINIVKIQRGSKEILIPSGDEKVFPGDILVAIGTTEQLGKFSAQISDNTKVQSNEQPVEFTLETITPDDESPLVGKSLRDSKLRNSGCIVVSVLRGNKLTTNPSADFVIEEGDHIWVAGTRDSVEWLK